MGTRFTIRLPRCEDVLISDLPRSAPQSFGQASVLIIDDEAAICRVLKRVLGKSLNVRTTTSSAEAAEWIAAGKRFDVILCDIMMPQTNGPELFHRIRAIDMEQADAMVFMTGGTFAKDIAEFVASVPNPCLEKPFSDAALRERIHEVLARSSRTNRRNVARPA